MTTSMRERIARAIKSKVPLEYGMREKEALEYADAALDALMEPTEGMCVAGLETNTRFGPRAMASIFRAMIRAARVTDGSGKEECMKELMEIDTAPRDGSIIDVVRIVDGEKLFEQRAAWRTVTFPSYHQSGMSLPEETVTGWMYPEIDKRVPKPTHWRPAGRAAKEGR